MLPRLLVVDRRGPDSSALVTCPPCLDERAAANWATRISARTQARTKNARGKTTSCRGPSLRLRPCSLRGDPIWNCPTGMIVHLGPGEPSWHRITEDLRRHNRHRVARFSIAARNSSRPVPAPIPARVAQQLCGLGQARCLPRHAPAAVIRWHDPDASRQCACSHPCTIPGRASPWRRRRAGDQSERSHRLLPAALRVPTRAASIRPATRPPMRLNDSIARMSAVA